MTVSMKRPGFMFYTGDWMKDSALSKCSPATRGIWIDAICAMHDSQGCGSLQGTPDQLARVLRCTALDVTSAVSELQDTKAADVRVFGDVVTLVNRRMQSEYEERLATRERVAKHRCNDPSSSSSSFSKENTPMPPQLDTPEFHQKLEQYRAYRTERKPKLTPHAEASLLSKLQAWGVERAIAALDHSMSNSWQGVFEPKNGSATEKSAARATAADKALEGLQ